jgi:hypothetical protein
MAGFLLAGSKHQFAGCLSPWVRAGRLHPRPRRPPDLDTHLLGVNSGHPRVPKSAKVDAIREDKQEGGNQVVVMVGTPESSIRTLSRTFVVDLPASQLGPGWRRKATGEPIPFSGPVSRVLGREPSMGAGLTSRAR